MLDELEQLYVDAPQGDDTRVLDPFPLSTGLPQLDAVLGGGVLRGQVLIVDCDLGAQARALQLGIARRCPHRTVIQGPGIAELGVDLTAAEARIPTVLIRNGQLSEADWAGIASAIGRLVTLDLHLTDAESLPVLHNVVVQADPDVVLVTRSDAFGDWPTSVSALAHLASDRSIAVVVTVPVDADGPSPDRDNVSCLTVCASQLGARATLIRPDEIRLVAIGHLTVSLLSGAVR